jgi:hypothetical protein
VPWRSRTHGVRGEARGARQRGGMLSTRRHQKHAQLARDGRGRAAGGPQGGVLLNSLVGGGRKGAHSKTDPTPQNNARCRRRCRPMLSASRPSPGNGADPGCGSPCSISQRFEVDVDREYALLKQTDAWTVQSHIIASLVNHSLHRQEQPQPQALRVPSPLSMLSVMETPAWIEEVWSEMKAERLVQSKRGSGPMRSLQPTAARRQPPLVGTRGIVKRRRSTTRWSIDDALTALRRCELGSAAHPPSSPGPHQCTTLAVWQPPPCRPRTTPRAKAREVSSWGTTGRVPQPCSTVCKSHTGYATAVVAEAKLERSHVADSLSAADLARFESIFIEV